MLDQDPDGHLIGEPDVGGGQAAVGDLPPEHLDVLRHPGREQVTVLRVGVEPFQLVISAGDLEGAPGDFRRARQRLGRARIVQPRAAPDQRDQEELRHRVQVERQQRPVAVPGRQARAVRLPGLVPGRGPHVGRTRPRGPVPGLLPRRGQRRSGQGRRGQGRSASSAVVQVHLARRAGGADLIGPLALVGQARRGQPPPGQPGRGQLGFLGPAGPAPGGRLLELAGDGHHQRLSLVEHGPRADQGGARVHEPAVGRLAVVLHSGQPDLVAVAFHVQRVGAADVGDPDAGRHRGDQARPPGESPARRDDQVDPGTPAEQQPSALADQHLLA